jgi:hypothetical protein
LLRTETPTSSGRLGTGAVVGIVVGVTAGIAGIVAAGIIFAFIFRKYRADRHSTTQTHR